jgi:DNA-binding response OmpR family regulator
MKRRILIVEDQEELNLLWSEFLGQLGHDVATATDLTSARQVLAAGFAPDLALIDWTLPDGSPVALAKGLAEQGCAIVVATGLGQEVTAAARDHGARILAKPFPLRELARLVADLVTS